MDSPNHRIRQSSHLRNRYSGFIITPGKIRRKCQDSLRPDRLQRRAISHLRRRTVLHLSWLSGPAVLHPDIR